MPSNNRPPSRRQAQVARKQRLDAVRKQQKRKARRQNLLVIGGSILAAALVLGLVGYSIANRKGKTDPLAAESISPAAPTGKAAKTAAGTVDTSKTSPIKGVVFYTGLTRNHVTTPVTYGETPPVGGDHNPTWLNCGVYNDPVPNENAVHDLEHGAVWITYQPALPADQVKTLIKLADSFKTFVTLSPYPNLPSPVVASAWGIQLKLDAAGDPRLKQFVKAYRLGPQTPEQGAICTGGTGEPRGTVQASDLLQPPTASPSSMPGTATTPATAPTTPATAPTTAGSTTPAG